MKTKTITIPIFFGDFTIVYCENWDEVNKRYQKRNNWLSPIENGFEAVVFPDADKTGYTRYVAAFRIVPKGSVIAHESVHLVNNLFKDRGLILDVYNDETQAYLTGWFYEQIEIFFNGLR